MKKLLLPLLLLAGIGYAKEPVKTPTPFVEHHNRIVIFDPLHQAYERIKPNALYAGIEAWLTAAYNHKHSVILETEFRMGYNFFFNGRDHLTPVLGVGVFKDYERHDHRTVVEDWGYFTVSWHKRKARPAIVYGMAGVLYDHEFNSVVNLGLNVKGMVGGSSGKNAGQPGDRPLWELMSAYPSLSVSAPNGIGISASSLLTFICTARKRLKTILASEAPSLIDSKCAIG